jgi:hypothetical protein
MNPPAYTADTSPDKLAVQAACFRVMAPAERIRKVCEMFHRSKRLAINAIRRRHPDLGPDEVRLTYIESAYGSTLADGVRRWLRKSKA